VATRKTRTKKARVKPIRTAQPRETRQRKVSATVAKPKAPTKESLLVQIGTVLDEVDAIMRDKRPKRDAVDWSSIYRGPLEQQRKTVDGLYRQLEAVTNPEGDYEAPGADEAIQAAFGAERGTVPSWARPGEFLMWLGYIPYRCIWGGFAKPSALLCAADPRGPFSEPSGYHQVHGLTRSIDATWPDVAGAFRAALAQLSMSKDFVLRSLVPDGVENVNLWLATPEAAWAIDPIKRGPVNEVPLPPRFAAVQQRMFA